MPLPLHRREPINRKIVVINIDEIPKISLRILLTLLLIVFLPYITLYGSELENEIQVLRQLFEYSFFSFLFRMVWVPTLFILIAILGIILHEAIHALFFSFFLPSRFQGVKFGFNEQYGIPFVHIKEPITVLGFRVGAIMPLVILGIIPVILGFFYGSFGPTAFGALFTISASGDLLLVLKTRGISSDQRLKDMSDKIGFEILPKAKLT